MLGFMDDKPVGLSDWGKVRIMILMFLLTQGSKDPK